MTQPTLRDPLQISFRCTLTSVQLCCTPTPEVRVPRLGLPNITVAQRNIEEEGFPEELHGEADALFLDLPGPWKVRACPCRWGGGGGGGAAIVTKQQIREMFRQTATCPSLHFLTRQISVCSAHSGRGISCSMLEARWLFLFLQPMHRTGAFQKSTSRYVQHQKAPLHKAAPGTLKDAGNSARALLLLASTQGEIKTAFRSVCFRSSALVRSSPTTGSGRSAPWRSF